MEEKLIWIIIFLTEILIFFLCLISYGAVNVLRNEKIQCWFLFLFCFSIKGIKKRMWSVIYLFRRFLMETSILFWSKYSTIMKRNAVPPSYLTHITKIKIQNVFLTYYFSFIFTSQWKNLVWTWNLQYLMQTHNHVRNYLRLLCKFKFYCLNYISVCMAFNMATTFYQGFIASPKRKFIVCVFCFVVVSMHRHYTFF